MSTDTPSTALLVEDIQFPPQLPVSERRDEIARAIASHQVVIVAGETGSGKTTQLPKICLALGRGQAGMIGHTQPRRLAARNVAARIASELGGELGAAVGYQVRFTERVSPQTQVKLMTDGILLAQLQHDRKLSAYDTLIIDEAHERSLNIDFLLGYIKRLLPRRPDLKVIITSATIDVESFARHFDDAPVIEVSGRTYPVQTVYQPVDSADSTQINQHIAQLLNDIDSGHFGPRGDVLIFQSGEGDIRDLAKTLRGADQFQVLPLYARLSQAEQDRVFNPRGGKGLRVVLATNVAETSLTVPGIRYVIDTGQARISRYSHRTKVQRLPVEAISQASANQRQGRCGRIAEGVCIRLYSEDDFLARPEFTAPEIQRTNLAAVILQMLLLRLGAVEDFPFVDPPDTKLVRDGYKLLEELAAVTSTGELTPLGRHMARLPIDPRLARMVLAASNSGCLQEVLIIASALAVQDPRERPAEKQQQSDQAHARFKHAKSDFFAYLALWRYVEEQRQALSQNQLRKLCQREFLSFMRLREWRDVHRQLVLACRQIGLSVRPELPQESHYDTVHKALLPGLLGNIAQLDVDEARQFVGARGRRLAIFPGSSQARKPPQWMVAAEVVETSKVYARTVAAIDPAWVVEVAGELLKRHYYEPRWQQRSGRVVAFERLSLYGLVVQDKRTVHYGPIDAAVAREIFIRQALIEGRYRHPPAFLKHNLEQIKALEELETRTRRRDIVVDDQVLFDFYDQLIPPRMNTAGKLQNWIKRQPRRDQQLRFPAELLLARSPGAQLLEQYPDSVHWQGMDLSLSYEFEPGKRHDGVTVTVPVGLLNRMPQHLFDWLVPGLLLEKIIALIKALPKALRKQLVPVPDIAAKALARLQPGNVSLVGQLSEVLGELTGLRIDAQDWSQSSVDDYYRMNIRVVDAEGKLLDQSRDLQGLLVKLRDQASQTRQQEVGEQLHRKGMKRWDIDALPVEFRAQQAGVEVVSYPALVDAGDSVAIETFDYPATAAWSHRNGVLRLFRQHCRDQDKYLGKQLLRGNEYSLLLAAAGAERAEWVDDLIGAASAQALNIDDIDLPRTKQAFLGLVECTRGKLVPTAGDIEQLIKVVLANLAELRRRLSGLEGKQQQHLVTDVESQLGALFMPGFMAASPAPWLQQYPRYLKALNYRCERFSGQLEKDLRHTQQLQGLTEPLLEAQQSRELLLQRCADAELYRWLLEEFRVSLFAQQLGTQRAVSAKRLQQQWLNVENWLKNNPI